MTINNISNIPLANATTYSGADTQVFIYRDLLDLLEKDQKGRTTRDTGSVTSSEQVFNTRNINEKFYDDSLTTTGNNQKGSPRGGGKFQKSAPTTQGDGVAADLSANIVTRNQSRGIFSSKSLDSLVKELGSLHSVTYSSFREKMAVRTLGRTHAKGYTRGQRTIAGTMVFNILQSHELMNFANAGVLEDNQVAMLDQIEPFNMMISFTNEYGAVSVMHLFNVDINTESQGMSIDQITTTNSMNFYAQDILPMLDVGNYFNDTNEMLHAAFTEKSFKDFISKLPNNFTGLKSLSSALGGRSQQDTSIQKLLKRSRGLF
jgi:hypothetical protein